MLIAPPTALDCGPLARQRIENRPKDVLIGYAYEDKKRF